MKLAILGASPIALETALRFHFHGAGLTLFITDEMPIGWSETENDFTRELGMKVLKEMGIDQKQSLSWDQWKENYQRPLIEFLKQNQSVREHEVTSVTKRFLGRKEEIEGRSRFYDLFRVIYQINPGQFIEEQKETNTEVYKKLTEEFIGSLQSTVEMYEDFDVVIDCRYPLQTKSMAVSGRALGESRVDLQKIIYGIDVLGSAPLEGDRDIAIIGSGALASEKIVALEEWLKNPSVNLFVVSTEEDPFEDFLKKASPLISKKLKRVLHSMEEDFSKEVANFEEKLRQWQEMDDFVRVKYPRPAEPIPRLNFFSGHNVTAVDELIDKRRIFLTLEHPDFREGKKHPANNGLELKTIGVDRIFVSIDPEKKQLTQDLREGEKGYFNLEPSFPNLEKAWENDLKELEGIENEIFNLFSPADTH